MRVRTWLLAAAALMVMPGPALAKVGLDDRTAVVTLTHDPKLDDPALVAALQSPVFYIGALGSTRTHAKRVERLSEQGLADLAPRIHAPVGLDLGGRAAAEIAYSKVVPRARINAAAIQTVIDLRKEMGVYKPPFAPPERFFDESYWRTATASLSG